MSQGNVTERMNDMKRIGVLALQGAFAEHKTMIEALGAEVFEIRQKADLIGNPMDGIILPGGESTVMGKLLKELDMLEELRRMILEGLPVMGTCAGLILLAKNISNDEHCYLGTMDITVKRNAYGRQLGSFHTIGNFIGIGEIPMTFIRAPYIEGAAASGEVEVLAAVEGNIVAAKQKNMLVTSFHPELTEDMRVHRFFLENM
jgi:pyridoxal 5'-phosphate synthase pdxT subunit